MGTLNYFNLQQYIKQYNTTIFFETGTYKGDGLVSAQRYGFKKLISVEINQELYTNVSKKFNNINNIIIKLDNSLSAMSDILPTIEENIIFWLDAHYPGADAGLSSYSSDEPNRIRLPLEEELLMIQKLRKNHQDVILVDDLRVYLNNGEWCSKNKRTDLKPNKEFDNSNFIQDILSDTHNLQIFYDDEIYGVYTPK
jgi:hypothetical protein